MYTMEQSLKNFSDSEADTQSRAPVTLEAEIPEMFFCPLSDKVCLVDKKYSWGHWKFWSSQGSCGKIAFGRCIDRLLSVLTEDALLLVNTGSLGIIESTRMHVRSSELDHRNAS